MIQMYPDVWLGAVISDEISSSVCVWDEIRSLDFTYRIHIYILVREITGRWKETYNNKCVDFVYSLACRFHVIILMVASEMQSASVSILKSNLKSDITC